jgi:hypothetical protein
MCPVRGVATQVGVRGHRHCMVVVHVARHGARTGSSSDREVAGDDLRPCICIKYKSMKWNPKSRGSCAAQILCFPVCVCVCVCVPGDSAPAFTGVFQQQQELDGLRGFQHGILPDRKVLNILIY